MTTFSQHLANHPPPSRPLQTMLDLYPKLASCTDDLIAAFQMIRSSLADGGCLYLCGNGGSMSDALHISGELLKSYILPRPLDADTQAKLHRAGPDGKSLGQALQRGLRLLPNLVRAEIVPGVGHSMIHKQPDWVTARIINFLDRYAV